MRCQLRRDLATVKGLAVRQRDLAQGGAGIGENKSLTRLRGAATRHECLRVTRLVLQQWGGAAPLVGHGASDSMAAFGQFDGACHQIGKRQLAKASGQGDPAGHGARGSHGVPATHGHRAAMAALEVLRVPGCRCHTRGVQAVQFLAVPQDGEVVAAQAIRHRLDNCHAGGGGDGRVHRVAALLQDA